MKSATKYRGGFGNSGKEEFEFCGFLEQALKLWFVPMDL